MPSQLKRLRESLKNAGIIGRPQQSKKAKKRARQNKSGNDARLSREAALESIREEFNPFEIKKNKEKFDVAGGRKVKGTVGKPGISKQIGEDNRRKTLLVEMQKRNKVGGIIDRRFGENDPTMAPEDRMLERFTREQQQRSHKNDIFNLEDEEEVLTHYGQSLGSLPTDDFRDGGNDSGSDDDLLRPAKRIHSADSDSGEDNEEDGPPKKKTKAEVMKEVIAKSKFHKYERQKEKEADEDLREELDAELGDIRALLAGIPVRPPPPKSASINGGLDNGSVHADRAAHINGGLDVNSKYDTSVREMTYDRRSKPADRTKSAEELAEERAAQLQKLEKSRQKRMRGEESSDEEVEEEDEMSDDEFGLGRGIQLAPEERDLVHGASGSENSSSEEDTEDEDEDEDDDEDDIQETELDTPQKTFSIRRRDLDNDDAYSDDYHSDEDADAIADVQNGQESEESNDDGDGLIESEDEAQPAVNGNGDLNTNSALPFTFPCPQSHAELLKITSSWKIEDLPTIVKRIRVLHHPSLGPDNKAKLSNFMLVLFDHIVYLVDLPNPISMHILEILLRHLHSLSKEFPQASAAKFREFLQKLFNRIGERKKTKRSDLVVLTALGVIFPTSDHFHTVVTPSMLVIARWLNSMPPLDLQTMVQGCYLVTLCLQYQRLSKRVVPEGINYIYQSLVALSPKSLPKIPGFFPVHRTDATSKLPISNSTTKILESTKLKFREALYIEKATDTSELKAKLGLTFMRQILAFAQLYNTTTAFLEITSPAVHILMHFASTAVAKSLPEELSSYAQEIALPELHRLRAHAQKFRRPLELHHHRPLPIPSNMPKFDEEYSLDRHKSSYDPDRERKEMSKLKAEYKKEKKGAMRELRKDSAFIAREKLRERKIADQEYHDKMRRIVSMIQNEEGAAANAYEREKSGRKKTRK